MEVQVQKFFCDPAHYNNTKSNRRKLDIFLIEEWLADVFMLLGWEDW